MAIKPRHQRKEKKPVEPWIIHFLFYGEIKSNPGIDKISSFKLTYDAKYQEKLWTGVKVNLLKNFIKNHPCSRPWGWWKFDAPKTPVPGWDYERFNSAQRLRLGGVGTPSHEVLNQWAGFPYGIPGSFVDQWFIDYYNGRAKDVHGDPIGTEYKEGDFEGVAIDPGDPPRFESEAAYLQRHGFLTPAEGRYLKEHKELLQPEIVAFDDDDDE